MNPDGTIDWTYVWATLIIRFVGVFMLLGILAIGIFIMTKIVARFTGNKENEVIDKA
ncbi:MAG TPA: hypothetical protein VJC37_06625 [Planctomycetota bacterium]|nr:hypothetical protein [Planctomycetota bacterium]